MTLLFSLCWLGEPWRIERYIKWLSFQKSIKNNLGFDRIVLVDNASNMEDLKQLEANIYDEHFNLLHTHPNSLIDIYTFKEHLPRTGIWEYPYCWRGLDFSKKLVTHYNADKVIFLDSDFYVLTTKLANYIKDLNSGWTSFHCNKYNFPEAAMHILCKDNITILMDFDIPSYTHYNNKHMEFLLPFTEIRKDFKGDRYGEGQDLQTKDMDYYGQWTVGCPDMKFDL